MSTPSLRVNGIKNPDGTNDVTGVYNVKDPAYGAKGDGTTDDTAAIQAAITAAGSGGRVFFPVGNYNLASVTNVAPLTTPNFVTLEGGGFYLGTGTPAATQLNFPNVGSGIGISAGTNINIKNLFFFGPTTGTAVSTTTHIQMWNTQIYSWATGVSMTNTFYGRLFDCEFRACTNAITTTGTYNLDLYGCVWRVCPTAINVTDRIAALNLFGGSMEGWSSAGAIVSGANSLINVNGVYFESSSVGNAGTCIKSTGTQNTFLLLGNQVYLTEASKWFDGNGQDKTTIFARGNKFIAAVGSTITPTAYTLGINTTAGAVDIGPDDWTGVLKVGSVFISGGVTAGHLNTLDNTGAATFTPGAASTISTKTGALTITTPAASTWSSSSGALTLTSAAAATWDNASGTMNTANVDVPTAGNVLGIGATRAGTINIGSTGNASLITSRANTFNFVANSLSAGSPGPFTFSIGTYTNVTASAESIGLDFNGSPTKTWNTGAIATQREYRFRAPTYAFNGASVITTAATVDITGAPAQGANSTITNAFALRVEAGGVSLGQGTVTQATSITTGVTVNTASGTITTVTANTAAASTSTFTVTCAACVAASVPNLSYNYAGTWNTNGLPGVAIGTVSAGSFQIVITNAHATNALNGVMKIYYQLS